MAGENRSKVLRYPETWMCEPAVLFVEA